MERDTLPPMEQDMVGTVQRSSYEDERKQLRIGDILFALRKRLILIGARDRNHAGAYFLSAWRDE